ncbi:MAG: hypothetical protein A2X36_06540 [Elusimicrobia bacterium GWA2_69_24]|nr:MAG: hypothetical protein A2X36_06540 [Elusimicrobia bacterium GWA2_69_24]HBL17951.1 hypothetical protein [Elusimicrobiota bacterium]
MFKRLFKNAPAWIGGAETPAPVALRIGIPRMFAYYIYPALWETFFKDLGMVPVVSGRSTMQTVRLGAQISETEHCLPNKLFDAHLAELVGQVDRVFVPRVLSTIKDHLSCPKFGPLPDAARAGIARDAVVLSVDIDETKTPLVETLHRLGRLLHTPRDRAAAAAEHGLSAMRAAHARMAAPLGRKGGPRFLLIGHPYVLHDDFLAGPVVQKLARMEAEVHRISFGDEAPAKSHILWSTSNKIFHKINSLAPGEYAGVIQLTVFNCGCDSMLIDTFRRAMKEKGVPYMHLMVDEHLSQSGMDTRIEAFLDSLAWAR